jgi:hypothetical protein
MQEEILLKSYDLQPFTNKDEYISFELYSTVKNLKENFLNNDFDLNAQFSTERNLSRKFFVYGKLYSKNVDTNNLTMCLSTTNNDVLYSPDIKNDFLPLGSKKVFIKPTQLAASETFSKNIFGKKVCSYFFQFEIKNDLSASTNNLTIQITGDSFSVANSSLSAETKSYNPVNNIFETPIVLYDDEGNFVPYGTNDVVFDNNFNLVNINNDFPYLYGCHFIRQDFDVVDENNVYFPYKVSTKTDGTVVYDNSVSITDATNFPKFSVLMDYPSFFGLEKVTIGAKKITGLNPNQYSLPYNLYNQNLFLQYSPWRNTPSTIAQWNVLGGAIKNTLRTITATDTTYGAQPIYNTPQQFYDNVNSYLLSFFKGCNLDITNPSAVNNNYFLRAFLNYNSSPYKKTVDQTTPGEFIVNVQSSGGTYFDSVDVSFAVGDMSKIFEIDLTKTVFTQNNEVLELDVINKENVGVQFPESLMVNIKAENTKPTLYFDTSYQNVQAFNKDIDIVVNLDKKYNGVNDVILFLNKISGSTTAVSLTDLKNKNLIPSSTNTNFKNSGSSEYDYEIIKNTAVIRKGDNSATFTVRVYYNDSYFIPKTINLSVSQSGNTFNILQSENVSTIDIQQSVVTSWTKYQIPSDPLVGIGIFRTNQGTTNSSDIFKYQIQSSDIKAPVKDKSFLTKFSYTVECINSGDTAISYDGEYGGVPANIPVGGTVFKQYITDEFQILEYVLPGNKNLITFRDTQGNNTIKYKNSKYEFRITNIESAVSGSTIDSDNYNDVIIPAVELSALHASNSSKTSEAWRTILRFANFFQTNSTAGQIAKTNLYTTIQPELTTAQNSSLYTSIISPGSIVNDFYNTIRTPSNPAGLEPFAYLVRQNVYALRTRVNNVYYSRPKHSDYNEISTQINTALLNNDNDVSGIILGSADMFGTVILNKTLTSSNGTNVEFRSFTNRVDLINIDVPSQTTFNIFTVQTGATGAQYLEQYFKFDYRVLEYSQYPSGDFANSPQKSNYATGANLSQKEASAYQIGLNGAPNSVTTAFYPSPSFGNLDWIKYKLQSDSTFNPLSSVLFYPNTAIGINSFSDSVTGTKLLPVYSPINLPINKLVF